MATINRGIVVTDHDILCGRGVHIARHPGNQRLRTLIRSRQDAMYCSDFSTSEKKALAHEIIDHIKNLNPPGRFLKREGRSSADRGLDGPWYELTQKEAVKKICQSLRDCNRPDREGYASNVQAPEDVVTSAQSRARSGLSLKEHAAAAAEAKDRRDSITRTTSLQLRMKPSSTVTMPPIKAQPTAKVTRNFQQRRVSSSSSTNLKSDPNLFYADTASSSHASTVTLSTRDTTSPVPTMAAGFTGHNMPVSSSGSGGGGGPAPTTTNNSIDPLTELHRHYQTPLESFRNIHHQDAVPVSASHHSGSPVQSCTMFGDDCPSSPPRMDMATSGDDLPTASKLVAGLTAPFSPVTWNNEKSTEEDPQVNEQHKLPEPYEFGQHSTDQVSLEWRLDGPVVGSSVNTSGSGTNIFQSHPHPPHQNQNNYHHQEQQQQQQQQQQFVPIAPYPNDAEDHEPLSLFRDDFPHSHQDHDLNRLA